MKFVSKFFILLIKFYQMFFSPISGKSCRFNPTCSNYAILSIKKFGIIKSIFLIIKRIFKCHPWGGSGYDPLPDK
tara:strand:- start:360 stop:584 length:225 start_codon:yes stop_codon:yes gene_type:complete